MILARFSLTPYSEDPWHTLGCVEWVSIYTAAGSCVRFVVNSAQTKSKQ